eukprot:CAMPEP_0114518946 /NCGR_PEP_ID=MMETSP0109-20121206/18722_1 /TAXON_ID=29199 /ORGANISM="Chlorarachnion reptans, Strain CCCM449" /LENGTH=92 /DNA_ID=CAMNT_0001699615 /DNA_START=573 /DNA_END=851 /DNA_ORIENTATION=+
MQILCDKSKPADMDGGIHAQGLLVYCVKHGQPLLRRHRPEIIFKLLIIDFAAYRFLQVDIMGDVPNHPADCVGQRADADEEHFHAHVDLQIH